MTYNPDIHHRRSIRLKGYDYSQAGMYFVTICVQNGECIFGDIVDGKMILNAAGQMIENEWINMKIKYPYVQLHEYVVMPNHFHGIIEICQTVGAGSARPDENANDIGVGSARPDENANDIGVGSARPDENANDIGVGFACPDYCPDERAGKPRPYVPTLGNMVGYFKYQTTKQINLPHKLWQRDMYEHIIRNWEDYIRIYDYILNNPAQWNLDKLYKQ